MGLGMLVNFRVWRLPNCLSWKSSCVCVCVCVCVCGVTCMDMTRTWHVFPTYLLCMLSRPWSRDTCTSNSAPRALVSLPHSSL